MAEYSPDSISRAFHTARLHATGRGRSVSFGLLARIAPQVQIYFLVVPGQIVLGLLLLALLLPAMLGLYASIARETFLALPGVR